MPNDLTLLDDLIAQMTSRSRIGYGKQLPGELDEVFCRVAQQMQLASPQEVSQMVKTVPDELGPFVLGFSDRMSILAIRQRDARMVSWAMMAHVLEDFRTDPRENMLRLALVHHVAETLGEDPYVVFGRAAALASEGASRDILAFLTRPPEMRSIDVMGIEPFDAPDGLSFRFVR
ncbi:MAG: hypothetical protein ACREPE_03020 [Lysobacter sp.]